MTVLACAAPGGRVHALGFGGRASEGLKSKTGGLGRTAGGMERTAVKERIRHALGSGWKGLSPDVTSRKQFAQIGLKLLKRSGPTMGYAAAVVLALYDLHQEWGKKAAEQDLPGLENQDLALKEAETKRQELEKQVEEKKKQVEEQQQQVHDLREQQQQQNQQREEQDLALRETERKWHELEKRVEEQRLQQDQQREDISRWKDFSTAKDKELRALQQQVEDLLMVKEKDVRDSTEMEEDEMTGSCAWDGSLDPRLFPVANISREALGAFSAAGKVVGAATIALFAACMTMRRRRKGA